MTYDDDPRNRDAGRERGPYTPPDDDVPFRRGGFDTRGGKAPPVTLLVSAGLLLLLIIVVVLFYRSGVRSSTDAPPAVGVPVEGLKVEAPIEAQPVDPTAGVDVYDAAEPADTPPVFTPPPETPAPRPTPAPAPVTGGALPPAASTPATRPPATPAAPPVVAPAPAPAPAPRGAGGSSAVQIGAFSSTEVADREYAAVAARFPQFAQGAQKRVQEVTASNGSTVYRTTFSGLSREDAVAFCNALKAAGRDCLVR